MPLVGTLTIFRNVVYINLKLVITLILNCDVYHVTYKGNIDIGPFDSEYYDFSYVNIAVSQFI